MLTKAYIISCRSSEQLKERMKILFSKGLVFTDGRYRSWEDIESLYSDSSSWLYIVSNHMECKRVLNTMSSKTDLYWTENGSVILNSIRFDVYLKRVVPYL